MIVKKIWLPLILKIIKEAHYKIRKQKINFLNTRTEIKQILCHSDLAVLKIIVINQVGHMILTIRNLPKKKWWDF